MKKAIWFLLFLAYAQASDGQLTTDIGVSGGLSSYFGEINQTRFLYSPSPAAGAFLRFNLHPRQAIRTSIFYGGLKGNDLDFSNQYQQTRGASFSGSVTEWALQFEFNFLQYSNQGKRWDFSPYLAGGVGIAFINTRAFTYVPVLPFAFGVKVNILKNLGLEAECGFRKTFYDNFDGLKDLVPPVDVPVIHNNDWYSFTGIALSWKIYSKRAGCPAYDDVVPVSKH